MSEQPVIRILINPDEPIFAEVESILERAVAEHSDHFDKVVNEPRIVDHFGYHNDMLSATVLSAEWKSRHHRLTIRPGLHPVFDELLAAVLRYWKVNENVSI